MRQALNFELDVDLRPQVEHVCLETVEPSVAARPGITRIGRTFKFASRLRSGTTELAFSTDHCLVVRLDRRGKTIRKYVVDLRFIHAEAETRIAWRLWLATAALAGLGALSYWLASHGWHQIGLQASVVVATASVCVGLLGLYQTRVTIDLRSTHGDAQLAAVACSLGNKSDARLFIDEISRRVETARDLPAQSKQHFLRDEMREHHRLWSEGVLSETAYEASKRRILAAHV